MRLFLALCLFLPCALHAEDNWHSLLQRIARSVTAAVNKSDNYICVQDLSRFYYVSVNHDVACRQPPTLPASPMRVQDRLKLDVAVSQGGEIYSWHGERKFSATSVSQVVQHGPIASGSFNGYLRNIFGERGVIFKFKGRAKVKDLDVVEFEYQVPLESSHYDVQAGKGFERAPFHGSFSAMADTLDLYSLTVTANGENLSDKANICAAETRLTYQMVKIGSRESRLPASFDLMMGSREGIFTESKGVYSECREYTGESTVTFDMDDNTGSATKASELQSEPLNAGLVMEIGLRSEIDEETAYAGLPVEAVLRHDLTIKKGVKLARGAILRGTLTQFEIYHQPVHSVSIRIEFNNVTDGGKLYLCDAVHFDFFSSFTPYAGGRGRRMPPLQAKTGGDIPDGLMMFPVQHLHLDHTYHAEFITVGQAQMESR